MLINQQSQEYMKCEASAEYFINNYFKIRHPFKGMVPLLLYPIQKEFINNITGDESLLTLASRQVGLTSVICGYTLWSLLFERKSIAIVCPNRLHANEVMASIHAAYDTLPQFLKLEAKEKNRYTLVLDNNSKLIITVANVNALRGLSLHTILVMDSCYIKSPFINSVLEMGIPALISNKGKIVLTSSGSVPKSEFMTLWDNPECKFKKFIIPWDSVPNRGQNFKDVMISNLGMDKWYQEYELIDNSK